MSSLNTGAVEQNFGFDALSRESWDDAFDCLPVREFCSMDPCFAANSADDFIPRSRVRVVPLAVISCEIY